MSQQAVEKQQSLSTSSSSSSSSSSLSMSNSISLIKLDELSSFGASKQNRLPALIKLNNQQQEESIRQPNSMPALSAEQLEKADAASELRQQTSLPVHLATSSAADKENLVQPNKADQSSSLTEDFQVVDMIVTNEPELVGPSLPQPQPVSESRQVAHTKAALSQVNSVQQLASMQHPSQLGDSLIDMIINLKNENQNLVRALETNNEYVKERLSEFKKVTEESKRREAQFALEKAEHEHQVRKLQRQNSVLSERLKSMEAKLKEMKIEVSESLDAARSSKASSIRQEASASELYPTLADDESFTNPATTYQQAPTMQVDAIAPSATSQEPAPMDATNSGKTVEIEPPRTHPLEGLSKEELSKRFDADKAEFYNLSDDPMKQCDRLEQQLNDIGKRDYEICLLQQQLNIYRQDFRLERLAKLEARIQIEKLKNDIDRLCLERLQEKVKSRTGPENTPGQSEPSQPQLSGPASAALAAADAVLGRLGHQLSKKAAKSAHKAAKYAAKQAHREEKAAAAAAAVAAATAAGASQTAAGEPGQHYGHGRRHHHHHHRHHPHRHSGGAGSGSGGIKSEVVSDLWSTANRAMLTGYKMASTHVNLALDKLSQFEQSQASQLAKNQQSAGDGETSAKVLEPSAPAMEPPSID